MLVAGLLPTGLSAAPLLGPLLGPLPTVPTTVPALPPAVTQLVPGLGATSVARPNILLMVSDDQAYSTFNRALMPTVFGQIVDKGIQFDRQYVGSALCCPSRGEIMTGLYEHNSGVDSNALQLTRPTIVDALKLSGYRTAMAGKYLNSHPCGTRRTEYDLWVCQGNDSSSYSLVNPRLNVNGTWVNNTGVAPEILANHLKNFIASTPATQPFFAVYTPTSPHMPANDPRYASMPVSPYRPLSYNENTTLGNKPAYSRIPPFDAALTSTIDDEYVRMSRSVRGLDDSVKTLLDSLGTRADNTIVIYISDNGYLYGEHRGHFKEAAYEESVKTPMAVRYPTAIPTGLVGTVSHALVQNVDLAPTFAEQAGIPWRVDGKSLMPLLTGQATTVRDAALIEHCNGPSYPCGVPRPYYLGVGFYLPPSFAGVVEDKFKFVSYATGEKELYDLSIDPNEAFNLAGKPNWATDQARLEAKLNVLKAPPPPDTTILWSSTGAPGTQLSTRTVGVTYFASVDKATFVCRLDRNGVAGTWASCPTTGYGVNALSDGDYTFLVAGVDKNGVTDATPDTRTFGVHTQGIPFNITPPPAATRLRNGKINFTATGTVTNVQCQLSRNGVGAWQACSAANGFTYSNLIDGRWVFRVRGTSLLQVVTNPPSEVAFTVDNVGPVAVFTAIPPVSTSSQTADFAFNFDEPTTGPVLCSLDGATAVACPTKTFHATGLAAGFHSIAVTGIDTLGNWGTTTRAWAVDRTAPVVTPISPTGTIGPNPLVKLNVSEPSTWIFSLDGGPQFDADPAFMFLYSLSNGPHTLVSRAIDRAGNLSAVVTQTWTQQTSAPAGLAAPSSAPPNVTIQTGPNVTTNRGTAAFAFTADQPGSTFECTVDGGGFSPCVSGVFYEDLAPGGHTFAVRATSSGGTGPTATWSWTVTT